jgi:hypothetical protein
MTGNRSTSPVPFDTNFYWYPTTLLRPQRCRDCASIVPNRKLSIFFSDQDCLATFRATVRTVRRPRNRLATIEKHVFL